MSIINELTNHVDTIREPLSKDSLVTPDRVLQILDTRAKYQTGVATGGFNLSYLRETPEVIFYRGTDRLEASEADPKTTAIIVPWTNMMAPIQFSGTDLEETLGIRSAQMLREDYSIRDMGEQRYVFTDFIMSRAAGTAASIQTARVQALWGGTAKIQQVDADRLPTTLPEIFDPDTGLYGEPKDALGRFEDGHPWSGTDKFGLSEDFKMVPRVWNVREADGTAGTTTNGKLDREDDNSFQSFYDACAQYSAVVPGTKIGICNNATFTQLALRYSETGNAYKFPTIVGTDQWRLQVRSVLIEDIYFIYDPYMPKDDEIWVLHIGDQNAGNGTVFPFYWDPSATIPELLRREQEMALRDIPDGMVWGMRRDIPFYIDDFERFAGRADAIGAWERLKWMLVAREPWCNMVLRGLT